MSPRIIFASVLGLSILCSGAALAQTSSGAGGGSSGTNGGSMGSGASGGGTGGSMGGTHGTSGTTSGTMNSNGQMDKSATAPSPDMITGNGASTSGPSHAPGSAAGSNSGK